ncbi:hypothetical protein [Nocardia lijiangensis]|uniref:hypothetical protein n=1 Tax=Nocardia lijiangensis TaxID=299618 RepID=UPI0008347E1A|nr:hypothetical protein [Nocardia lijiangensis]
MTGLDDLLLEQSIRRRVGVPGTITRITEGSPSILSEFRAVAERIGGLSIELVTVSDGIPGHFGLRGRHDHTVVFHQRQLEVCAHMHGVWLEQRFDGGLMDSVFEGTVLLLVAEFLLQSGHPDQALATLAKSHRVQSGIHVYAPRITDVTALPRDERYMVEWFFALGHEIGHHIRPELQNSLADLPYFAPSTVARVVDAVIDMQFDSDDARRLNEIIGRGDDGSLPKSHAATDVVRAESIADLFSVICMSESWNALCANAVGRDYLPHHLLLESMISMSSVLTIEQCRIMAGWFSSMSYVLETQSLALARVALQARTNLLAMTLRDSDIQHHLAARYPSLGTFLRLDDSAFHRAMVWLQSRSNQLSEPFGRARAFLSSPEMRDAGLLQTYFEAVATDRTTSFFARDFLRVAAHLDAPLLDALREVIDGAPPPVIEQVGNPVTY